MDKVNNRNESELPKDIEMYNLYKKHDFARI